MITAGLVLATAASAKADGYLHLDGYTACPAGSSFAGGDRESTLCAHDENTRYLQVGRYTACPAGSSWAGGDTSTTYCSY